MEQRFELFSNPVGGSFVKRLTMASKVINDSTLPAATYELVKIRASQINGCGYCTDMHTKDAAHAGETSVRLNLIAAWHEATVFTEAERAALALTEEATRIGDGRAVSDAVWQEVRKHYDDDQIAALIAAIAMINAWNRMNVIARTPAGSYVPGQWG
ncbi:carboxymuconolactone decarboxylase family protein [Nocardia abscessus]|uniref:Carboxymuconolactone decarboxylase family protein n=1 Tax=Nocardia abscessus TaxID=120957 RepID=A0ABS0C2B4_9NOCA|nr:carboxymuconolactone decarboxylase family protein [Nocardia abscessus]MBF6224514.1 carboxymuconolactone decarboxylase family protein [Nocardia abscessus]MCC3328639.1 carboxymuconolactone decarboxylase family protein [Nocardia abscessus]